MTIQRELQIRDVLVGGQKIVRHANGLPLDGIVFQSDPIEGQSVRVPYYFLTADQDISNLQLALNGHSLTRFSISDVFEDGSQYYYKFLLSQSDLAALS